MFDDYSSNSNIVQKSYFVGSKKNDKTNTPMYISINDTSKIRSNKKENFEDNFTKEKSDSKYFNINTNTKPSPRNNKFNIDNEENILSEQSENSSEKENPIESFNKKPINNRESMIEKNEKKKSHNGIIKNYTKNNINLNAKNDSLIRGSYINTSNVDSDEYENNFNDTQNMSRNFAINYLRVLLRSKKNIEVILHEKELRNILNDLVNSPDSDFYYLYDKIPDFHPTNFLPQKENKEMRERFKKYQEYFRFPLIFGAKNHGENKDENSLMEVEFYKFGKTFEGSLRKRYGILGGGRLISSAKPMDQFDINNSKDKTQYLKDAEIIKENYDEMEGKEKDDWQNYNKYYRVTIIYYKDKEKAKVSKYYLYTKNADEQEKIYQMLQTIKLEMNHSGECCAILKNLKNIIKESYTNYIIIKLLAIKRKLKNREKVKEYLNNFYVEDKEKISDFLSSLKFRLKKVYKYQQKYIRFRGLWRKPLKCLKLYEKQYNMKYPGLSHINCDTLVNSSKFIANYMKNMLIGRRRNNPRKAIAFKVLSNANKSMIVRYLVEEGLSMNFNEICIYSPKTSEIYLNKIEIFDITSVIFNVSINENENGILILGPPKGEFAGINNYKICYCLKNTTEKNKNLIFYDKIRFKEEGLVKGISLICFQFFNLELSIIDFPDINSYKTSFFYMYIKGGNIGEDLYKSPIFRCKFSNENKALIELNWQICLNANFFCNGENKISIGFVRIENNNGCNNDIDNVMMKYLSKIEMFKFEYSLNDVKLNKTYTYTPKPLRRSKLIMNIVPFFIDEDAASQCGYKFLDENNYNLKLYPYESCGPFIGNKFYLISPIDEEKIKEMYEKKSVPYIYKKWVLDEYFSMKNKGVKNYNNEYNSKYQSRGGNIEKLNVDNNDENNNFNNDSYIMNDVGDFKEEEEEDIKSSNQEIFKILCEFKGVTSNNEYLYFNYFTNELRCKKIRKENLILLQKNMFNILDQTEITNINEDKENNIKNLVSNYAWYKYIAFKDFYQQRIFIEVLKKLRRKAVYNYFLKRNAGGNINQNLFLIDPYITIDSLIPSKDQYNKNKLMSKNSALGQSENQKKYSYVHNLFLSIEKVEFRSDYNLEYNSSLQFSVTKTRTDRESDLLRETKNRNNWGLLTFLNTLYSYNNNALGSTEEYQNFLANRNPGNNNINGNSILFTSQNNMNDDIKEIDKKSETNTKSKSKNGVSHTIQTKYTLDKEKFNNGQKILNTDFLRPEEKILKFDIEPNKGNLIEISLIQSSIETTNRQDLLTAFFDVEEQIGNSILYKISKKKLEKSEESGEIFADFFELPLVIKSVPKMKNGIQEKIVGIIIIKVIYTNTNDVNCLSFPMYRFSLLKKFANFCIENPISYRIILAMSTYEPNSQKISNLHRIFEKFDGTSLSDLLQAGKASEVVGFCRENGMRKNDFVNPISASYMNGRFFLNEISKYFSNEKRNEFYRIFISSEWRNLLASIKPTENNIQNNNNQNDSSIDYSIYNNFPSNETIIKWYNQDNEYFNKIRELFYLGLPDHLSRKMIWNKLLNIDEIFENTIARLREYKSLDSFLKSINLNDMGEVYILFNKIANDYQNDEYLDAIDTFIDIDIKELIENNGTLKFQKDIDTVRSIIKSFYHWSTLKIGLYDPKTKDNIKNYNYYSGMLNLCYRIFNMVHSPSDTFWFLAGISQIIPMFNLNYKYTDFSIYSLVLRLILEKHHNVLYEKLISLNFPFEYFIGNALSSIFSSYFFSDSLYTKLLDSFIFESIMVHKTEKDKKLHLRLLCSITLTLIVENENKFLCASSPFQIENILKSLRFSVVNDQVFVDKVNRNLNKYFLRNNDGIIGRTLGKIGEIVGKFISSNKDDKDNTLCIKKCFNLKESNEIKEDKEKIKEMNLSWDKKRGYIEEILYDGYFNKLSLQNSTLHSKFSNLILILNNAQDNKISLDSWKKNIKKMLKKHDENKFSPSIGMTRGFLFIFGGFTVKNEEKNMTFDGDFEVKIFSDEKNEMKMKVEVKDGKVFVLEEEQVGKIKYSLTSNKLIYFHFSSPNYPSPLFEFRLHISNIPLLSPVSLELVSVNSPLLARAPTKAILGISLIKICDFCLGAEYSRLYLAVFGEPGRNMDEDVRKKMLEGDGWEQLRNIKNIRNRGNWENMVNMENIRNRLNMGNTSVKISELLSKESNGEDRNDFGYKGRINGRYLDNDNYQEYNDNRNDITGKFENNTNEGNKISRNNTSVNNDYSEFDVWQKEIRSEQICEVINQNYHKSLSPLYQYYLDRNFLCDKHSYKEILNSKDTIINDLAEIIQNLFTFANQNNVESINNLLDMYIQSLSKENNITLTEIFIDIYLNNNVLNINSNDILYNIYSFCSLKNKNDIVTIKDICDIVYSLYKKFEIYFSINDIENMVNYFFKKETFSHIKNVIVFDYKNINRIKQIMYDTNCYSIYNDNEGLYYDLTSEFIHIYNNFDQIYKILRLPKKLDMNPQSKYNVLLILKIILEKYDFLNKYSTGSYNTIIINYMKEYTNEEFTFKFTKSKDNIYNIYFEDINEKYPEIFLEKIQMNQIDIYKSILTYAHYSFLFNNSYNYYVPFDITFHKFKELIMKLPYLKELIFRNCYQTLQNNNGNTLKKSISTKIIEYNQVIVDLVNKKNMIMEFIFTNSTDNVKSLNNYNENIFLIDYRVLSTNKIRNLYDIIINKIKYIDLSKIENNKYIAQALDDWFSLKFYNQRIIKSNNETKENEGFKITTTLDPNLPLYMCFSNNKLISKNIHFSIDLTKSLNKCMYGIVKLRGYAKFEINKDVGYYEWRKCSFEKLDNNKLIGINFDCLNMEPLDENEENLKMEKQKKDSFIENNINFNYLCTNTVTLSSENSNIDKYLIREKEDDIMKNILINRENDFDVL